MALIDGALEQEGIEAGDDFALLHRGVEVRERISRTRPDTWLPTWTLTSADSVPLAVTFAITGPRSAETVS